MQPNAGSLLLFSILLIVPASSQTAAPVLSQHAELPGITLPIQFTMAGPNEMAIAQQQGGYYRPNNVPPAPHGAPCGHEDSGVCPVDVPIPPGATGEQLYQLGKQQDQRHLAEAIAYLTASANLGYGPAEGALGTAYVMGGNGVRHDAVKGVNLLELAAAQGQRGAAVYLGMEYEDGDNGVPHNQAKAIFYLKQAAAEHHSIAWASTTKLATASPTTARWPSNTCAAPQPIIPPTLLPPKPPICWPPLVTLNFRALMRLTKS
jgi:Sel1 repeat